MPNCYFACFFWCCSGHRSRTVCFCINDWITYYSLMVTDPRERPLQWLQGKQLLAPLTSRYSHRFGWISEFLKHNNTQLSPCWVKIEANTLGSLCYAVLQGQIKLIGSWCWRDAVCYVGQRKWRGAHTGARCEGGTLGGTNPAGGSCWGGFWCVFRSILLLFCSYLPFSFHSTDT